MKPFPQPSKAIVNARRVAEFALTSSGYRRTRQTARDAVGGVVTTWAVSTTATPCFLNPYRGVEALEAEKLTGRIRALLFLPAGTVTGPSESWLVDGTVWDVVGPPLSRSPDEIHVVIEVSRTP